MARIVITRPNGDIEYAELTTDKEQAGNDRLTVTKNGNTYYAKLDSDLSTHMYVIKPDGRKLYVQKEVSFTWKYVFDGTWENASKMVIPRTGLYEFRYGDTNMQAELLKGSKFNRNYDSWEIRDTYGVPYRNEMPVSGEEDSSISLDVIEYIGES